jgi:hypothetical protein
MKTLKNISLTLIIFLGGIFTACNDDKGDSLDLTADVDILSFKVNNVEGIINNDNHIRVRFQNRHPLAAGC